MKSFKLLFQYDDIWNKTYFFMLYEFSVQFLFSLKLFH